MTSTTEPGPMTGARLALVLVSAVTALIAAWLTLVLVTVVPVRSPASLPAWLSVDAIVIALLVASAAWIARPGGGIRLALRVAGIAAAILGAWLASAWLRASSADDVE